MDMNPLDKIKEGVLNLDWSLVCEGYTTMTGKLLIKPVQPCKKNVLMLETTYSESTIQLFKDCLRQMIDEFEFVQTVIDEPDTKDIVGLNEPNYPVGNDDKKHDDDDDDDEGDIDFEEITEQNEKVGLYGNPTILITEEITPERVEANRKQLAKRSVQKVSRPPPRKYKVKCTDCEKTFDSDISTSKFGQKCPKCLRSMGRDR